MAKQVLAQPHKGNYIYDARHTKDTLKSLGLNYGLPAVGIGAGVGALSHLVKYLVDDRYALGEDDHSELPVQYTPEQQKMVKELTRDDIRPVGLPQPVTKPKKTKAAGDIPYPGKSIIRAEDPITQTPEPTLSDKLMMFAGGNLWKHNNALPGPLEPGAESYQIGSRPTWYWPAATALGIGGVYGTKYLMDRLLGGKRKELSKERLLDSQVEFEREKRRINKAAAASELCKEAGIDGLLYGAMAIPALFGGLIGYREGTDPARENQMAMYKQRIDKKNYDRRSKQLRKSLMQADDANPDVEVDSDIDEYDNLPKTASFLEGLRNATFFKEAGVGGWFDDILSGAKDRAINYGTQKIEDTFDKADPAEQAKMRTDIESAGNNLDPQGMAGVRTATDKLMNNPLVQEGFTEGIKSKFAGEGSWFDNLIGDQFGSSGMLSGVVGTGMVGSKIRTEVPKMIHEKVTDIDNNATQAKEVGKVMAGAGDPNLLKGAGLGAFEKYKEPATKGFVDGMMEAVPKNENMRNPLTSLAARAGTNDTFKSIMGTIGSAAGGIKDFMSPLLGAAGSFLGGGQLGQLFQGGAGTGGGTGGASTSQPDVNFNDQQYGMSKSQSACGLLLSMAKAAEDAAQSGNFTDSFYTLGKNIGKSPDIVDPVAKAVNDKLVPGAVKEVVPENSMFGVGKYVQRAFSGDFDGGFDSIKNIFSGGGQTAPGSGA